LNWVFVSSAPTTCSYQRAGSYPCRENASEASYALQNFSICDDDVKMSLWSLSIEGGISNASHLGAFELTTSLRVDSLMACC
jgi:hypothetical protein